MNTQNHFQQPSPLWSSGQLCTLIQVYFVKWANWSWENALAIMWAQLKTVDCWLKEHYKYLDSECLEHHHSRVLVLLLKLVCLFLLWEVKSISCEKLPSTWRSPMTNVYYSLQRTAQTGSNQSRERSSGPGAQLRKRTRGQLECQRSARLWLRLISLRKATFKGQCQSVDSVFSFHLTTYLMNSSLVFTENVISFGRSKM